MDPAASQLQESQATILKLEAELQAKDAELEALRKQMTGGRTPDLSATCSEQPESLTALCIQTEMGQLSADILSP